VQNIEIPLLRCAKSDGSYDIGVVIPQARNGFHFHLTQLSPVFSTPKIVGLQRTPCCRILRFHLEGGDAIVDFLYQGQAFQRALSIQNFLTNPVTVQNIAVPPGATYDTPGSFYIIGQNDD